MENNTNVSDYLKIINGPLAEYCKISHSFGGDVEAQSQIVMRAFQVQHGYLTFLSKTGTPRCNEEYTALLQPTQKQINAVQEYRDNHRHSTYFNHLSAISESIFALGWVTVRRDPAVYIKEAIDVSLFYGNKVLTEWKEKDTTHVQWVNFWTQALRELQNFVNEHHAKGLIWTKTLTRINDAQQDDQSVSKNDEKIVKLDEAPIMHQLHAPNICHQGKKLLIEFQTGNRDLLLKDLEMNNIIYMYKCTDSMLSVEGKINSIILDSCEKTSVLFETLISSIEFINCASVKMQVRGKVPTITIDKTDDCQIFLNQDSLDVEIITSKSSAMNVMVPKLNGELVEYSIPHQCRTTLHPGSKTNNLMIENTINYY